MEGLVEPHRMRSGTKSLNRCCMRTGQVCSQPGCVHIYSRKCRAHCVHPPSSSGIQSFSRLDEQGPLASESTRLSLALPGISYQTLLFWSLLSVLSLSVKPGHLPPEASRPLPDLAESPVGWRQPPETVKPQSNEERSMDRRRFP